MRANVRPALPAALGCIVVALTMLVPAGPTTALDRNEAVVGPAPVSAEEAQQLLERYRAMAPQATAQPSPFDVQRYLDSMGMRDGLMDAMMKVPSKFMRHLTSREVVTYGLDNSNPNGNLQ